MFAVNSTILEINTTVPIPTDITVYFNGIKNRLYVLNILGFDKMLCISETNKIKAEEKFSEFISGEYIISNKKWKVKFDISEEILEEIKRSTGAINRISNFDNEFIDDADQI